VFIVLTLSEYWLKKRKKKERKVKKRKTQEIPTLQQRSKPPEIRCVRYRYTAVKMSQSKGFFTNPPAINDYLG